MAVEKTQARIGFFVIVVATVAIGTLALFVERARDREVLELVTYTEQNVSGLDVGSQVRFKGVPLGRVAGVRITPTGGVIEIDFEVFVDRMLSVGVDVERIRRLADSSDFGSFRAQVVSHPITSESYLEIDVPDNPPPAIALGFTPERPYVPSLPSNLSDVQSRLPTLLARIEATLETVEVVATRLPTTLDHADSFFTNVERILEESDLPATSAESRALFATLQRLSRDVERLAGEDGSMTKLVDEARVALEAANLPATAAAARSALEHGSLATDDLRRVLPPMVDALDQLRELARFLESQPESVIYGARPATEVAP